MSKCYNDLETLKDDMIVGAGPIAHFYYGEDTLKTRCAVYHRYEHGRLPGATRYGSQIALSRSIALAAIWADGIRGREDHAVRLTELHLQLDQLAAALLTCGIHQPELAALAYLLKATQETVKAVLEIRRE
jgi:hypothetical protein